MAYDTEDTDCLDLPVAAQSARRTDAAAPSPGNPGDAVADDAAIKAAKRKKDAERKQMERDEVKEWVKKNAVDPRVSLERTTEPSHKRLRKYAILTREQQMERHRQAISTLKDENILKRLARRALPEAFAAHMSIINASKNDAARMTAIKELYERAVGKSHVMPEAQEKPGANITVNFGEKPKNVVIDSRARDVEDADDDDQDA